MLKVLIQPEYLAFLNQKQVPTGILIQVLLFLRFALLKAVRSSFDDLNYSLRIFQGYSLFSYQCSLLFSATLIYYHNHLCLSTTFLFYFVHHLMSERRRRDLNPRAAINDLHPFQGCPFGQLGYFSEYITRYLIRSLKISNSIVFLMSGEDGIRTHVPLRTNGFQDRLVMTTSIPLRVSHLNQCEIYSIIRTPLCQPFFLHFLIFFVLPSNVLSFRVL